MQNRALICGISGQDGGYLARLLLDKGYEVWGTSRDVHMGNFANLHTLGIYQQVNLLSMAPTDFRSVLSALSESDPGEVYFLAGQTSVNLSFQQPVEALESISVGALNVLEAIRFISYKSTTSQDEGIRFYHASSSEVFGDIAGGAANESTSFCPSSPYAAAKASAHWIVSNYRAAYNIFACNGILFNHESQLRPARFVTRKIIDTALAIKRGEGGKLRLGRLDIVRDWGYAPEYVDAMWRMMQHEEANDYVVASGVAASLQDFVEAVFACLDLDWREHVVSDKNLYRPVDIAWSQGDPRLAYRDLGWVAQTTMPELATRLVRECSKDCEEK